MTFSRQNILIVLMDPSDVRRTLAGLVIKGMQQIHF